jgi:hypothetical protein
VAPSATRAFAALMTMKEKIAIASVEAARRG